MRIRLGSKEFRLDIIKGVEKIDTHLALLRFINGNFIQVHCVEYDIEDSVYFKGTPEELKVFIEKLKE